MVIADTSPVNYLILIGQIELLPQLFEKVVLPTAVQDELGDQDAPPEVRKWIANPPVWLEIYEIAGLEKDFIEGLDNGDAAVIALASRLEADLLLMDERAGVLAARMKGLKVTGTLSILDLAADRGLLDFAQAIQQLEKTSFRRPVEVLEGLLQKHKEQRS
ncbi:MAG: DUF3368 domain-containing protein [Acidobacteriota bacterium]